MQQIDCEVLYRPESEQLRFLPEGPIDLGDSRFSWVAIQHGAESTVGSLNIFDIDDRTNSSYPLPGRPGFAFPAKSTGRFIVGLERHVQLFDLEKRELTQISPMIDEGVEGTIINDGERFEQGLVFGSKDLKFRDKKAGLYLWRDHDQRLIRLRDDQICSNGKVIVNRGGNLSLLDIDTPTKTVVRYELDVERGTIGEPTIVVDMRDGDVFPDGMVATPDGGGVIIAFYNPQDAPFGEARQYNLSTGEVEAIWRTEGSPQVTCPQLVRVRGSLKIVLTTAVEHMSQLRRAAHPNAGCIFIGDMPAP